MDALTGLRSYLARTGLMAKGVPYERTKLRWNVRPSGTGAPPLRPVQGRSSDSVGRFTYIRFRRLLSVLISASEKVSTAAM
jgi:hypothetical protein